MNCEEFIHDVFYDGQRLRLECAHAPPSDPRERWLRDWREARVTRGHSGTAADFVHTIGNIDTIATRANLAKGWDSGWIGDSQPPGERRRRLRMLLGYGDTSSPNLPDWWTR